MAQIVLQLARFISVCHLIKDKLVVSEPLYFYQSYTECLILEKIILCSLPPPSILPVFTVPARSVSPLSSPSSLSAPCPTPPALLPSPSSFCFARVALSDRPSWNKPVSVFVSCVGGEKAGEKTVQKCRKTLPLPA